MKRIMLKADKRVKGFSYAVIRNLYEQERRTASEIAAIVMCTVTRIGQVLREMGFDPFSQGQAIRLERIRSRKIARDAEISAEGIRTRKIRQRERKDALLTRYRPWLALWNDGYGVAEIARRNGTSTQIASTTIIRLRKRYGWFSHKAFKKNSMRKR